MGPEGELEEVKSDESGEKERRVSGNDWRRAVRAGRHNEVPRGYDHGDGSMQREVKQVSGVHLELLDE